ncbi:MAG: hypothetical protein GX275_00230 [Clostridiales bacterium]|nr:hypothetical protein [Clostridiales bacterium]
MKKSIIYVSNNYLIYNKEWYDINSFIKVPNMEKNRIIILLEHQLYISTGYIKKGTSIKEIIHENFGGDENYLVQYFYINKGKKAIIYAVNESKNLIPILKGSVKTKILPIQTYVASIMNKKNKNKSWNLLFKFRNVIYLIMHNSTNIYFSFFTGNEELLMSKINELNIKNNLYVLKDCNINIGYKYENISLGDIFNEKNLCK